MRVSGRGRESKRATACISVVAFHLAFAFFVPRDRYERMLEEQQAEIYSRRKSQVREHIQSVPHYSGGLFTAGRSRLHLQGLLYSGVQQRPCPVSLRLAPPLLPAHKLHVSTQISTAFIHPRSNISLQPLQQNAPLPTARSWLPD